MKPQNNLQPKAFPTRNNDIEIEVVIVFDYALLSGLF